MSTEGLDGLTAGWLTGNMLTAGWLLGVTSGRLAAGWLLAGIEMVISGELAGGRGWLVGCWAVGSLAVGTSCWVATGRLVSGWAVAVLETDTGRRGYFSLYGLRVNFLPILHEFDNLKT